MNWNDHGLKGRNHLKFYIGHTRRNWNNSVPHVLYYYYCWYCHMIWKHFLDARFGRINVATDKAAVEFLPMTPRMYPTVRIGVRVGCGGAWPSDTDWCRYHWVAYVDIDWMDPFRYGSVGFNMRRGAFKKECSAIVTKFDDMISVSDCTDGIGSLLGHADSPWYEPRDLPHLRSGSERFPAVGFDSRMAWNFTNGMELSKNIKSIFLDCCCDLSFSPTAGCACEMPHKVAQNCQGALLRCNVPSSIFPYVNVAFFDINDFIPSLPNRIRSSQTVQQRTCSCRFGWDRRSVRIC